jgi:alanine racemase
VFKAITLQLKKALPYSFKRHISNSSGIVNYPEAHFDLVRLGIGLYGYANDWKWTQQLKNVSTLYSVISQIHVVNEGESVGYNRSFKAQQKTKSATISLGYADGIPRSWGNGVGFVTINDKEATVIGNVCMDTLMVDVTNIDCKEGDIVLFFNTKKNVEEMAARTKTISYELITAISQRMPREIVPIDGI